MAAVKHSVHVDIASSAADYHTALRSAGSDDPAAVASAADGDAHADALRRLCAGGVIVVPVRRLRHVAENLTAAAVEDVRATVVGDGDGDGDDDGERKTSEVRRRLSQSGGPVGQSSGTDAADVDGDVGGGGGGAMRWERRRLLLTSSHVVELSADGGRVLFRRSLLDVEAAVLCGLPRACGLAPLSHVHAHSDSGANTCSCGAGVGGGGGAGSVDADADVCSRLAVASAVDGAFALSFRSDGAVKVFVAAACTSLTHAHDGCAVMRDGGDGGGGLAVGAGLCAPSVVAELLVSNIVSAARRAGGCVDLMTKVRRAVSRHVSV